VLLEEFQKLISKHMNFQKRHGDPLCCYEKLIDSYALLEATHEVMLIMVIFSQSHTCKRENDEPIDSYALLVII
jgi:hypothetical protein